MAEAEATGAPMPFSRGVVPVPFDPGHATDHVLRVLLLNLQLSQYERTLLEAGMTMSVLLDLPGPVMEEELATKIGMEPAEISKLRKNILSAEKAANEWEAAHARR